MTSTIQTKSPLKKGIFFTDIHFGKKGNSDLHNRDCLDFIDWVIGLIKEDPTIDYVGFLGDWHENRSTLNIATLNHSFQGIAKLNTLNIPVFFCVGNHDLYHRHTRAVHSVPHFSELTNIHLIDQPVIVNTVGGEMVFSPFLFHDEYPQLAEYLKKPLWAGHFEFKGFAITGYNTIMATGPDPSDYQGPELILSGHFHKRQADGNICYIGNTFPMDFGDANDFERGVAILDHAASNDLTFVNWEDCPKYITADLVDVLHEKITIDQKTRLKCISYQPITYEESLVLKSDLMEKYKLRELVLEERIKPVEGDEGQVNELEEFGDSIDNSVVNFLSTITGDGVDPSLLIKLYMDIPEVGVL